MSMFNGPLGRQIFDRFDRIFRQPQEVLVRAVVIYFTVIGLIVPNFVSVAMLMNDVFVSTTPPKMLDGLYEGVILGVVFLFAMGIIYAMSAGYRQLQYVIVVISFVLAMFAGGFLGQISNHCIPDGCDTNKYYLSLAVVGVIAFTAYVLPALVRFRVPYFGVAFLAVAVWQSELWIMITMDRVGVEPSADNLRGLFLLIYALIWVGLFATMQHPQQTRPR